MLRNDTLILIAYTGFAMVLVFVMWLVVVQFNRVTDALMTQLGEIAEGLWGEWF